MPEILLVPTPQGPEKQPHHKRNRESAKEPEGLVLRHLDDEGDVVEPVEKNDGAANVEVIKVREIDHLQQNDDRKKEIQRPGTDSLEGLRFKNEVIEGEEQKWNGERGANDDVVEAPA